MNRLAVFPVVLVAVALTALLPDPGPGLILTLAALLPAVLSRRVTLSPTAEIVFGGCALGLGVALMAPFLPPKDVVEVGILRNGWARLGAATLSVAIFRLYVERPVGGVPVTLVFAVLALVAAGGTQSGWIFPASVVAFVALGALARWASDRSSPASSDLSVRHLGAGAVIVAVAGLSALAWGAVLPSIYSWGVSRLMTLGPSARVGFSDRLWLGSLRGMLGSDELVLRIRGPHTDYLRGIVYDEYHDGRWLPNRTGEGAVHPFPDHLSKGPDRVEVEFVGEPGYYFLPLGVSDVAVERGVATLESGGSLRPVAASVARRVWFHRGDDHALPIARPARSDVNVPPALRGELARLADEWIGEESSPRRQIEAIEKALQTRYHYSLDFERSRGQDPMLAFLLSDKHGHCEYFASGMALVTRAAGFPARVVAGYRVTEHNPVGGYDVVRQRNAHTWVEAWVPGEGWRTFDPTPPLPLAEQSFREMAFLPAVMDVIGSAWGTALSELDQLTWTELLTPLFALLLLLGTLRWAARRRRNASMASAPVSECLAMILGALRGRGVVIHRGETVEAFARRVRVDEDLGTDGPAVHDLLMRYSALRYGDIGSERELSRDVSAWVRRDRASEGRGRRRVVAVLFTLLIGGCSKPSASGDAPAAEAPLRLAVATNFTVPAERIAKAFREKTGVVVAISTGSSGKLFAQIENGAPFDVFLSADAERPERLVERGRAVAGSRRRYALGQLALYGPAVKHPNDGVVDLRRADYRYLSIANPDTAPYGAAAREVLRRLDLWEALEPRIVRGENIGQAFQFVESGGAELGLVALSSVVDEAKHPYWRVPVRFHGAIQQEAVLVARDGAHPRAAAFMEFLGSAEARDIIEAAGYGTGEGT